MSVQRKLATVAHLELASLSGAERSEAMCTVEEMLASGPGRILRVSGNAALIEFDSPRVAVEWAFKLIQNVAEGNIRFGIHSGDLSEAPNRLFEVLDRLQSMASPGAVCITPEVMDELPVELRHRATEVHEAPRRPLPELNAVYEIVCLHPGLDSRARSFPRRSRGGIVVTGPARACSVGARPKVDSPYRAGIRRRVITNVGKMAAPCFAGASSALPGAPSDKAAKWLLVVLVISMAILVARCSSKPSFQNEKVWGGIEEYAKPPQPMGDQWVLHSEPAAPLLEAAESGSLETARLLLESGADPKRQPEVLQAAIRRKDVAMARLLIEHGAPVDQVTATGQLPLEVALQSGDLPTLELLLQQKINPNRRNTLGDTPLIIAAHDASGAVISALLAHGADPLLKDRSGRTPLVHAIGAGNHNAVPRLLNARSFEQRDVILSEGYRLFLNRAYKEAEEFFSAALIILQNSPKGGEWSFWTAEAEYQIQSPKLLLVLLADECAQKSGAHPSREFRRAESIFSKTKLNRDTSHGLPLYTRIPKGPAVAMRETFYLTKEALDRKILNPEVEIELLVRAELPREAGVVDVWRTVRALGH